MEEITSKLKKILKGFSYLEGASISELSFKPDFMVNFSNRLLCIEIAYLEKNENVDWKTLRLIERLFETKLFLGNNTVFSLIIPDREGWKPYCLELIKAFFDKVIYGHKFDNIENIYTNPKKNNFDLWEQERKFIRSRYNKLKESDLRQFKYLDVPDKKLEDVLCNKLVGLGLEPIRNYPIRNLKNYYLKKDMDLRFYFDFFVNYKIVEIKTFTKINNAILQNLLIKSRLIRYQKIDDRISPLPSNKMILFINGKITGPGYDRMRYLRMLTTAGWDVYPISLLYNEKKLSQVFNNG